MTTRSKEPVVVVAANNRAPALPSTSCVIEPSETAPSKNSAVMDDGTLVFGCNSKPNVVESANVRVALVNPFVQSTRGVALSVSGGGPHELQLSGTVSWTTAISKSTVCVPSVMNVNAEKSGAPSEIKF